MPKPGLLHGDFEIPGLAGDPRISPFEMDIVVLKTFGLAGATVQSGDATTSSIQVPMMLWSGEFGTTWTHDQLMAKFLEMVRRAGSRGISDLRFYNYALQETRIYKRCKMLQPEPGQIRSDLRHGARMEVVVPFLCFFDRRVGGTL